MPIALSCPASRSASAFSALLALAASVAPLAAQESQARFDAPLVVLSKNQPTFRHLVDCNGDGLVDALGYDRESTGGGFLVSAYLGDGTGTLTSLPTRAVSPSSTRSQARS